MTPIESQPRLSGSGSLVTLPSGERIPALGQGTHMLGTDAARRPGEVAALRLGIELGMTVIDTAEVYSSGGAEEVVGEAIASCRQDVFVVSKVHPSHSSGAEVVRSCEGSLRRLGLDCLDLYLLHWPCDHIALAEETFAAFDGLVRAGKLRYWGVSNFAVCDLEYLHGLEREHQVAMDQILYNVLRRDGDAEADVIPWCRQRGIPIMAYCPLERGVFAHSKPLTEIGARYGATPAQVALAWLLHQDGTLVIPKAASVEHVRQNQAATTLILDESDLAALDLAFPPPSSARPFQML
jgi:diketogulonate reductase-like aldo/keto reductase